MRKLILLTFPIVCISLISQAQISKGAVLLGGNLSATNQESTSSNNYETSTSGFNIAPSIGFVTKENTVWGFNTGFNHTKNKSITYPERQQSTGFSGGLFFRKYVTLGKGFYLFGQANAGYNQQKQESKFLTNNYSSVYKNHYVGVSAYPGITYAVNKRFHLEAGLNELVSFGYRKENYKESHTGSESTTKSNGFSFSTNLSNSNPLNVGFRLIIGK
jgi:hypothetical protein